MIFGPRFETPQHINTVVGNDLQEMTGDIVAEQSELSALFTIVLSDAILGKCSHHVDVSEHLE